MVDSMAQAPRERERKKVRAPPKISFGFQWHRFARTFP